VLVVVPRLVTQLVKPGVLPLGELTWGSAALPLAGTWKNIYTDEVVEGETLALSQIFAMFPVAVLERG